MTFLLITLVASLTGLVCGIALGTITRLDQVTILDDEVNDFLESHPRLSLLSNGKGYVVTAIDYEETDVGDFTEDEWKPTPWEAIEDYRKTF